MFLLHFSLSCFTNFVFPQIVVKETCWYLLNSIFFLICQTFKLPGEWLISLSYLGHVSWLCIFTYTFPTSSSAAAAKSLQLCPTLCDPIDSSPPGSPVPGILQARTLEWVAIFFSNAWKWKVKGKSLSHVRLLATPWAATYQAPPSMGFSRQECWSGLQSPSLLHQLLSFNPLQSDIYFQQFVLNYFLHGYYLLYLFTLCILVMSLYLPLLIFLASLIQ